MFDPTITEIAIDPKWQVDIIAWADGGSAMVLRIDHPRHGVLNLALPATSAVNLSEALRKAVNA